MKLICLRTYKHNHSSLKPPLIRPINSITPLELLLRCATVMSSFFWSWGYSCCIRTADSRRRWRKRTLPTRAGAMTRTHSTCRVLLFTIYDRVIYNCYVRESIINAMLQVGKNDATRRDESCYNVILFMPRFYPLGCFQFLPFSIFLFLYYAILL